MSLQQFRDILNHQTEISQIIDIPKERPSGSFISPVKSKYDANIHNRLARVLSELGLTNHDLAKAIGVNALTILNWSKKYPLFKEAIQEGRDFFNFEIAEQALGKRVTGFDYNEDTLERKIIGRKIFNIETDEQITEEQYEEGLLKAKNKSKYKASVRMDPIWGMVLTKRVKKHVTPDTRAIEYYLNNRSRFNPDEQGRPRWTHHNKLEVVGKDDTPLIPENISPEALLSAIVERQKKEDDAIEVEVQEVKKIGVETTEEEHQEEQE